MNNLLKTWRMLPRPERGAATEDELYTAVGAALSTWELVEEGLAEIFATFVGSPEAGPGSGHDPAIRAFGSVLTFKGRQEMVAAAKQAFFWRAELDDDLSNQFGRINEEAGGFAGRRNEIAHGRVQYIPEKGFYLFPGLYNTSKNPIDKPAAYAYGPNEVYHYRESFDILAEKLSDYAICVAAWVPPPPSRKKGYGPSEPPPLPRPTPRKSRTRNASRRKSSPE